MPAQDYMALVWALVIGLMAGACAFVFIFWMKFIKVPVLVACFPFLTPPQWGVHRSRLDSHPLLLSILGASLVGLCGVLSPAALFWGEHELHWAVQMGGSGVKLPYAQVSALLFCSGSFDASSPTTRAQV